MVDGEVMRFQTPIESLLLSTMRIETSVSVGTSFIVRHQWGEETEGYYLITNKHVIKGTDSGVLTFTVAPEVPDPAHPQPDLSHHIRNELKGGYWKWVGHPSDSVDVAALPIVQLLKDLGEEGKRPYYNTIDTWLFPDATAFEHMDAIEELVFVGYPSGMYDRTNNLPLVRRGLAASPIQIDYEGKPVFLIDASVFPGSSGSPVLICDSGPWSDRGRSIRSGTRVCLLGILSSAFLRRNDGTIVFEEVPSAQRPVVKTEEMIDLGVVFKARTIMETIEHLAHVFDTATVDHPDRFENR